MYPCDKGVQLTRALGRRAWGFSLFLLPSTASSPRGLWDISGLWSV
jgi:hypothetical protein